MPKRRPKGRSSSARPVRRRPGTASEARSSSSAVTAQIVAELVDPLDAALDEPEPLAFLQIAAVSAAVLTDTDGQPGAERSDRDAFLRMLTQLDATATDALLAALAVLIPETVPLRVARNELPLWLVRLQNARVTAAAAIVDPLRDADNLLIEVTLADERGFTMVALVDHNLGTVVKDVFPLPGPMAPVLQDMGAWSPTLAGRIEDPAAVSSRLRESLARADALPDPLRSDTWPACRPLLDWTLRMVEPTGSGWVFEHHTDEELAALAAEVLAAASSPIGPDSQDVVATLLDFAATTALHDPLRWSPSSIEILFMDWLPRRGLHQRRWPRSRRRSRRSCRSRTRAAVCRHSRPRRRCRRSRCGPDRRESLRAQR